ncbi:CRISPR-associated protein Cas2 [Bacillus thuringiensis]|nr:CRISPR-associated protein Cas2 [Bacillus thuringiensis]
MKSYLISYDLIEPGQDYNKIEKKIETYPNYKRILQSVWVVQTPKEAEEIAQELYRVTDSNDKIFVARLESNPADKNAWWFNLDEEHTQWLLKNL